MKRTSFQQERRMEKFVDILERYNGLHLSQSDAAELLGMSERSFRRYKIRYENEGLEGLKDRCLGKKSPRAVPQSEINRMLKLYKSKHEGWSVRHFHDYLQLHHQYRWGYTWTKNQLQKAGYIRKNTIKGKHRIKRERKPCVGMMLHQDGSTHAWLEGQPHLDLIVTMDDATSAIYSAFLVEEEGTQSSFQGMLDVLQKHGLPSSIYTDRGSHYFYTPEAGGKVDKGQRTQFGRAMKQLNIEHIAAYSPEARGRSERAFSTLQDRLVNELKFKGIKDIAEANRYIQEVYLPDHNQRFAVKPADDFDGFVSIAHKEGLRDILCLQEDRVVQNDNCVRYKGMKLQIPASPLRHHYVKAKVKICEYFDGELAIFHGPRCIGRYGQNGGILKENCSGNQEVQKDVA